MPSNVIFSVTGGAGPEAKIFLKILCDKIASKTGQDYANVVNFLKCKIAFLLRKLVLICIRGSRTFKKTDLFANHENDFDYGCFVSKL